MLTLTFETNSNPLLFVKLMSDTLRSIGYYRYMTTYSKRDDSGFVWQITLKSEYATDPISLRHELLKRGCDIADVVKESDTQWFYTVDMSNAHIEAEEVAPQQELQLKRSLEPHWLVVKEVKKLQITSLGSNRWHPYIVFFDKKLHLLKVYKRDSKTWQIRISMPKNGYYIKIADLYNLKNIKDGLRIEALGSR